jgi:myo-inositol 2-dehydrogenase/D-chiro-inositol 1-dehydrogenase
MTGRIGIGFIGAGAVVKSVHLPVLARMSDRFRVAAVWDVNPAAAEEVAAQSGAHVMTNLADLLASEEVDVLAICTPAQFHAEHAIAGMLAGKRAILCEKPLATSYEEAQRIGEASDETGVPLIVGAMHMFDPAWTSVRAQLGAALARDAVTIRSSIILPFNERFEQWATEVGERPAPSFDGDDIHALIMRMGVLELGIHDLPLVRTFIPESTPITVTAASLQEPFGYSISISARDRVLDLFAQMKPGWRPCWELEVASSSCTLHIEFPPSFVHAGSAVATISQSTGATIAGPFEANGYEGEWQAVFDVVRGSGAGIPSPWEAVEDFRFALNIADQSCTVMAKESQA